MNTNLHELERFRGHYKSYIMSKLILEDEVYFIVGCCFTVWNILRFGFSEIIYKDSLEIEFIGNKLPYLREPSLAVFYKGVLLKHSFKADFVLFGDLILEIKSCDEGIPAYSIQQTLNYLKVSGKRIGLIVNFGRNKVEYKRLIQ